MSFCPAHGFFIGTSCTLCQLKGPLRICPKHDWNMGTYCAACRDEALTAYRSAFAGIDLAKGKDWTGVKVMKAPTEQQLRDPAWWDENAPESTSHIHRASGLFAKRDFGGWLIWNYRQKYWEKPVFLKCGNEEFIPRPTKPQRQEWDGEGLPPVGCECELTLGFVAYERVAITYIGDGVFCYRNMRNGVEYTGALSDANFWPIRTQAERERDELAEIIANKVVYNLEPGGNQIGVEVGEAVDAIIAAGWRKGAE